MVFECSLDERICKYVSKGNEVAFDVVCKYHMDEVIKIRNCMLEILRDKYFYNIEKINQSFYEAVVCLEIDFQDLVEPTVTVISVEPKLLKNAGFFS